MAKKNAIRCVVPVSGGKDSQLCLKLAVQQFGSDSVIGLFCDTQFEHPKTYAHITAMALLYGVSIITISAGSVESKCEKYKRFPSGVARFCTDELKIRPSRDWYSDFVKKNGPFVVWYGMRTGESLQRSARYRGRLSEETYQPHDLLPGKYPKRLGAAGVLFRLPIVHWSDSEVLAELGVNSNPLYREGFGRVGCFPCLASGPCVKAKAFGHDEFGHAQSLKVIAIGKRIGKNPMAGDGQICGVCLI